MMHYTCAYVHTYVCNTSVYNNYVMLNNYKLVPFFSPSADNKMVLLYESAAKSYPNNEDILTHLYMAYVRVDEYQKQQKVGGAKEGVVCHCVFIRSQTAVQLLKQFPSNAPYYCWRVMSILMQVSPCQLSNNSNNYYCSRDYHRHRV